MRETIVIIVIFILTIMMGFEAGYIYKGWEVHKCETLARKAVEDIKTLQKRVTKLEEKYQKSIPKIMEKNKK